MKNKIKNRTLVWLCMVSAFLLFGARPASAQLCPSSLMCVNGQSLALQFNNGAHGATELFNLMQSNSATIDFGENSPLNGDYFLLITSGGFGSPPPVQYWYIEGIPLQPPGDFQGTLTLGGIMQCSYSLNNEATEITCETGNTNCECPALNIGLYPQYVRFIQGHYAPGYPLQPNSEISVVFEWGQSSAGPSTSTFWPSGPDYFESVFNEETLPPCCSPYTGAVIFNNDKTCYYENHLPIGCGEDCSSMLDCSAALEELVLNMPGTGCKKWYSTCNTVSAIHRSGKVSIGGAATPNGYNLGIGGGVMTDYLKVELCGTGGWCDYVFNNDYNLIPLPEVESFIGENGHLPGVPSENELKNSGGIEIKSTMLKQQEKIEEIFLYMIALEERVLEMEEKANALETENKVLRVTSNK